MRNLFFLLITLLPYSVFSQVQSFTLDNGLRLLVKEDHRAPVVVSMIWYTVGSADEPGGITGTSHALEHLMFKGTSNVPMGAFSKAIAALGGQDNAFTNNDYTAYFEKVAAPHLSLVFSLEADRMQHLLLGKDEFDKEIRVIQEERRLRTDDNPQALTFERFLATAHLTAPYNHPVIGWMSDLKQMTVEDARAWYTRYYTPNNAIVVVVGDVLAKDVYHLAKQHFGSLKKQPLPVRKPQPEPPPLGPKTVLIEAPAQVPMLMIGYTVPTVNTTSNTTQHDPYALELIAGILDAGDSGRVTQRLVRGLQVASNVDIFYNLYARYQTQFILYGTPSQSHSLNELKKGIFSEIKRLQEEPISSEELQRVKTQIIAQKTFERDSQFGQAMELGLLETIGLGWKTADKYIDRIHQVTPKHIQQAAIRYFQHNNQTEARLIPKERQ